MNPAPYTKAMPSPHPSEPNRSWAREIIDAMIRGGVGHICISPGSRSTPLTLAAAERAASGLDSAVGLSVHYDERSAAFFALGYARATGRPALCVCTSGTAAANYLPAVIEAHYSRAPLILLTADRPPELRDTGAWQVIDQTKLFGVYTRWYAELGLPSDSEEMLRYARSVAARAAAMSMGRPPGPVHIDVPMRDPFPAWDTHGDDVRDRHGPSDASGTSDAYRTRGAYGTRSEGDARDPSDASDVSDFAKPHPGPTSHASITTPPVGPIEALAQRIRAAPRGLILAGRLNCSSSPEYAEAVARLALAGGYPILAEPLGGLRFGIHDRSHVITGYDAFMRAEGWTADPASGPELVLRFGASFTWRVVSDWLARFPKAHTVVIDPEVTWDDPARLASERFEADPIAICVALTERLEGQAPGDSRQAEADLWRRRWLEAAERATDVRRRGLDGSLEPDAQPIDVRRRGLDGSLDPGGHLIDVQVAGAELPGADLASTSAWVSDAIIDAIGDRNGLIWVANSMAVRDIDTFTGPRPEPITVMAGRGAAGIDGTLSQALGAALGWQRGSTLGPAESSSGSRPAVLITGDLAFLHDVNGLAAPMPEVPQLAVVVVDDAGGGIFEYLPVAGGDRTEFERYFATPSHVNIEAVCAAFGVPCETVRSSDALMAATSTAIHAGGLRVIRVPVDRVSNTAWHRAYWAAVAVEVNRESGAQAPITPLHIVRLDRAEALSTAGSKVDARIESTPEAALESTPEAIIETTPRARSQPPIVLLHGFTGAGSTWRPFADALIATSRAAGDPPRALLAPDLVGHGESADQDFAAAHSIPSQIASLVAALEDLDVQRAIWCGYSMGGRIALSLAVAHPERVAGLVLIGASAGIADPAERAARQAQDWALAEGLITEGLEAFVDRWSGNPLFETQRALGAEHHLRMRAQRMRNLPKSLARSLQEAGTGSMEPVHAALATLDVPTLIVAGALDPKFAAIGAEMAAMMPNARFTLIEGAGHAVQLEAPAALADEVAAFVRGLEAG